MPTTKRTFVISLLGAFTWGVSAAFYSLSYLDRLRIDKMHADFDKTSKEMASDAAKDKAAAIEQVSQKFGSNTDRMVTVGFEDLNKKYPWLDQARKSVAQVGYTQSSESYPFGSAVLLDGQGTLVMTNHQARELKKYGAVDLYFSPEPDKYYESMAKARIDYANGLQDIAFATLEDPSKIGKFGLVPVQWGQMGYRGTEVGQNVVSVGWPDDVQCLHATNGTITRFNKDLIFDDKTRATCKMSDTGATSDGMSGGGAFRDGKFVGITESGTHPGMNPELDFTPADLIREAYVDLYPDRARAAGISAPTAFRNQRTISECVFNRRSFLAMFR